MNAVLEDVMREVVKLTKYIQSLDSQITQTEAYRILVTVISKYKQKCDRNPQAKVELLNIIKEFKNLHYEK